MIARHDGILAAPTFRPVIGEVGPMIDWPFAQFETATVEGLASVSRRTIHLLAIAAKHPGRGDGARFLAELQREYDTVGFWIIHNDQFAAMLARRRYRPARKRFSDEWCEGMVWRRGKP